MFCLLPASVAHSFCSLGVVRSQVCAPLAAGRILFLTPAADGHGGAHDLSYCGCFFSIQCQTVYLVCYLGVELLASWLSHIREFCACVRRLIIVCQRSKNIVWKWSQKSSVMICETIPRERERERGRLKTTAENGRRLPGSHCLYCLGSCCVFASLVSRSLYVFGGRTGQRHANYIRIIWFWERSWLSTTKAWGSAFFSASVMEQHRGAET